MSGGGVGGGAGGGGARRGSQGAAGRARQIGSLVSFSSPREQPKGCCCRCRDQRDAEGSNDSVVQKSWERGEY